MLPPIEVVPGDKPIGPPNVTFKDGVVETLYIKAYEFIFISSFFFVGGLIVGFIVGDLHNV